jgi:hypothetical protein
LLPLSINEEAAPVLLSIGLPSTIGTTGKIYTTDPWRAKPKTPKPLKASIRSSDLIVGKENEEWFAGLKKNELLKFESSVSPVGMLLLIQENLTYSLGRTDGNRQLYRQLHVSRDIE